MTSLRLWVHRHYDTLKIVGIYINVLLAGGLFLYAMNISAEGGRRTTEVTKQIVEANEREQSKQTAILQEALDNQAKQAQAQCVLLFQLVGEDALARIDPSVKNDCLNSVGEQPEADSTASASEEPQVGPSTTATQPESTARRETPTTSAPPETPSAPSQPVQPTTPPATRPGPVTRLLGPVIGLTDRLLDGVLGGMR